MSVSSESHEYHHVHGQQHGSGSHQATPRTNTPLAHSGGHLHQGHNHQEHNHQMFFGTSSSFSFLFHSWDCRTAEGFLAALVVTLLISLLNEALAYSLHLEEHVFGRSGSSRCLADIWRRLACSLLHIIRLSNAYILMLAAMTFNGILFALIIAGSGLGHFLFRPLLLTLYTGWRQRRRLKSQNNDVMSCDEDSANEKWLKTDEEHVQLQEITSDLKLLSMKDKARCEDGV
ncbi:copper transporter 1 [Aplysia californica]|uniref:Copper transport protein n=1 Tax=Aplysia californica TaxID=6500 RepID=A0ABM0JU53_APLCA|nr:copper transporter 1 [Aplysia californica]